MQKRGLGRGLSALIPSSPEHVQVVDIQIDDIEPNPRQPRRRFDERSLTELASSIKEHGIVQPLLVRRTGSGYELLAGERRLRAARLAGLERVPGIVRSAEEQEALEIALIENVQREDLNPIDEGLAYRRLLDEFGLTQEELAVKVGKNRSTIANAMRLLNLPDPIQGLIQSGALTAGHARAILSVGDEKTQLALAKRISEGGLSVRQAESLVKAMDKPRPQARKEDRQDVAQSIGRNLGAKVRVRVGNAGSGRIEIHFSSLEELERLSRRLASRGTQTPKALDGPLPESKTPVV